MQMLDVHFPTTDGRTLIFRRITAPNNTLKLLLTQPGPQLPRNPRPESLPAAKSNLCLHSLRSEDLLSPISC